MMRERDGNPLRRRRSPAPPSPNKVERQAEYQTGLIYEWIAQRDDRPTHRQIAT
jgi:hypothetical protein